MSLLIGIGLLALLTVAGWWPMAMLAAPLAGTAGWSRAAFALALGTASAGLVQVALSAFGLPATVWVPMGLALASLLACRLAPAAPPEQRSPRLPRLLAAWLLAVTLVGSAAAAGLPFSSDGLKFWGPRARELARVGAAASPTLHDPLRLAWHRDYPLLVPAQLAPAFALSPPDASAGPKLVLHGFVLALLGVVTSLALRHGSQGAWLAAGFAAMPFLANVSVRESASSGGYADAAVALYLALFVVTIDRLRHGLGGRRDVVLAALVGAALASTKREGAVWPLVVVAAWLLAGPVRRAWWPCLLGGLVLCLPTFFIRAGVVDDQGMLQQALWLDPTALWARSLPVAAGLAGLAMEVSCFGLLPLALAALVLGRQVRSPAFLLWTGVGVTLFLVAVYTSTNMLAAHHLYTSAHRLVFQWLPAWTLLVAAGGAAVVGGAERHDEA